MASDFLSAAHGLSDDELVRRLASLAGRERATTAELVAHIAELDSRDLHLRAGYGSLFVYCRDVLHLSEAEAYNRIEAARAARRFPLVLERLEEGSINLTTIRLVGRHLTLQNHRAVLEAVRWRKKSQVEEVMVGLWPQPDAATLVRKLPAPPRAISTPAAAPSPQTGSPTSALPVTSPTTPPTAPQQRWATEAQRPMQAPGRSPAVPLSPNRYKIQFTIPGETLEKLRLAKDMLQHANPSGDEAVILDRALTALLEDLAKKKFGLTDRPRPAQKRAAGSRHISAEVRRAVWRRDLGRCAFVAADGRRCAERALLEFHHVEPYAIGGEVTVKNIQLRCRRHNAYEARLVFGPSLLSATDSSRSESRASGAVRSAPVVPPMSHRAAASRGG